MSDIVIEAELEIMDITTEQHFVGHVSIERNELEAILNKYGLTIKEKK